MIMQRSFFRLMVVVLALVSWASQAVAQESNCRRVYKDLQATIAFHEASLQASQTLHAGVLLKRLEAGRLLSQAVLADMRQEPTLELLNQSLTALQEVKQQLGQLTQDLAMLKQIDAANESIPEYDLALTRLLNSHPPVQRVSLINQRFANISRNNVVETHYGPLGRSYDELLTNLDHDLKLLIDIHDKALADFQAIMGKVEKGGIAALLFFGRSPFPDRLMFAGAQVMTYAQHFNAACATTMAAALYVYPKGLEWLVKP